MLLSYIALLNIFILTLTEKITKEDQSIKRKSCIKILLTVVLTILLLFTALISLVHFSVYVMQAGNNTSWVPFLANALLGESIFIRMSYLFPFFVQVYVLVHLLQTTKMTEAMSKLTVTSAAGLAIISLAAIFLLFRRPDKEMLLGWLQTVTIAVTSLLLLPLLHYLVKVQIIARN